MSSDQLAAAGAFLSGISSVITAAFFVRRMRRNARRECDERLAEYDRALHEGVRIGRGHEDSQND